MQQALPIIIQGLNKIVPFVRDSFPVLLAKGGLVTKPTRALIGEAGPEIVVPIHKLGDAIGMCTSKDQRHCWKQQLDS
ncbi:MAG: hypothetical protein CM15mV22_0230 [Eurybiavirus sp.]|nr:MAG: hypothetical protein CM15mV22_0230 [Eurybiavirus sp.]